jgi:purine nucleoside phosphorylase
MRVLGLSLITNKAAGLAPEGPSHGDVLKVAGGRHADFVRLIEGVVACMS